MIHGDHQNILSLAMMPQQSAKIKIKPQRYLLT